MCKENKQDVMFMVGITIYLSYQVPCYQKTVNGVTILRFVKMHFLGKCEYSLSQSHEVGPYLNLLVKQKPSC